MRYTYHFFISRVLRIQRQLFIKLYLALKRMSSRTIVRSSFESTNKVTPIANLDGDTKMHSQLSNAFRNLITREEVERLAKVAISEDTELTNYQLRPYSEEKLGFLGTHLCLIVTVRQPKTEEKETLSFFVKTLPYDVPLQAAYIEEKGCFRKEAEFFQYIVPMLMECYKGDSWSPKCYLIKKNLLIFEDMKVKGFSNRSREFNEKSLKAAIACIARFHASSLLIEEKLNGQKLNDLHPELLRETEFQRTGRSYVWYKVAMDLAVSMANEMGLDSSKIYESSKRVFDICEPSKTKRNVISHGDLWSSNLIFDGYDNCKLVDFQLVRYTPLAHDLMQLMYLTTTREFRQRYETEMVKYYYQTLKDTLSSNNFGGLVPSYQEVLQGVEEQRFAALVVAMIFHPTVLMDGKIAARIMNDPETYEAYYFKDRKPFVDEIMVEFPDYELKIRENVRELVEMSLIVDSLPRPS